MGDGTGPPANDLLDAIASYTEEFEKNRRASLFHVLPRLLATYFERHGQQPETASDRPCLSDFSEGNFVPKEETITEATRTIAHANLHEAKSASKGHSAVYINKETSTIFTPTDLNEAESGMKGALVGLNEGITTVTEMDLQKQSAKERNTNEDSSRNANLDYSLASLEGFFDWLDAEADMGKYAGLIKRTRGSRLGFLREFLRLPIGSGVMGQPLNRMMCCNNTELRRCPHAAAYRWACDKCWLVAYCSKTCWLEHFLCHKASICDSLHSRQMDLSFPLQEEIMKRYKELPKRANEDDADAEIGNPTLPLYGLLEDLSFEGGAQQISIDAYLRKNLKTDEDTLSKSQNPFHGCLFPDQVRLLFPALYDLRNIFETVRNIPDDYKGGITLFLNCVEAKLAVRDFLILELLRYHGPAAIDLAIGLWYSTALTATQDTHLMLTILRMLDKWESSLSVTGGQHPSARYKQPFPLSTKGSYLRADFGTKIWSNLRELVSHDECNWRGFNAEHQYTGRRSKDNTFKVNACTPSSLASWSTFERLGLLLPYGAPKDSFNTPNRLRYSWKSDRIARYKNDPASGWAITMMLARSKWGRELYGLLYFKLRELMEVFLHKTAHCCVQLRLMQFQTKKLFQILKDSGMKFHRIDACGLYHDKDVSPEQAMQWCGDLLAEDASPAWPSLLLTATLSKWEGEEAVGREAYKKGMEVKKRMMSAGPSDRDYEAPSYFWKFVDPVTVWAYVRRFEFERFTIMSSDEEAGIKKTQGHVAATFGLHKQRRHRIVSPVPGVALKHSQLTPAVAADLYVNDNAHSFLNLVFSGFTFHELFHEWGWDPSQR